MYIKIKAKINLLSNECTYTRALARTVQIKIKIESICTMYCWNPNGYKLHIFKNLQNKATIQGTLRFFPIKIL